jgi:Putative phage tail protein
MPETVGLLLLQPLAPAIGIGGVEILSGLSFAGISLPAVIGATAIIGVSIGLQYALSHPTPPKPEAGSQAIRQAVPPRIRAYGINRLAGYYMLYEAAGAPAASSFDVIAFHSGRIDSVVTFLLSDDIVQLSGDISHGGAATVLSTYGDGRYGGVVVIELQLGNHSAAFGTLTTNPLINSIWTPAHIGHGIAACAILCASTSDPATYSRKFPRGKPELSVVAVCSPCWDPRDPAQHRDNEATWRPSYNPVIQLIDYLTRIDGGMGKDFDRMIAPVLSLWIAEANLCDEMVAKADGSFEPRYQSHGWFQFNNAPENVLGDMLATCDGWLAESGDGTLSLVVGVYRAPTDPPLTEADIKGFSLNYGETDEELVNALDITFTDPAQKYVSVQTEPWRDEASIAAVGAVKSKPLDLQWVQSNSQARRLADRAMMRLNAVMTGSFTTSLYGLGYLGKRWVPVQYPFVSGLQDCVVEIQDAEIDLMAGRINWNFLRISTDDIEAYDPEADEGTAPPVPPANADLTYLREDGTGLMRESAENYLREASV